MGWWHSLSGGVAVATWPRCGRRRRTSCGIRSPAVSRLRPTPTGAPNEDLLCGIRSPAVSRLRPLTEASRSGRLPRGIRSPAVSRLRPLAVQPAGPAGTPVAFALRRCRGCDPQRRSTAPRGLSGGGIRSPAVSRLRRSRGSSSPRSPRVWHSLSGGVAVATGAGGVDGTQPGATWHSLSGGVAVATAPVGTLDRSG